MSQVETPDPASEGEGARDDSARKEAEGLRAAMLAERDKRQVLEREVSELKGRIEGMPQKPAEFTASDLQRQVDEGRMSQDEARRILDDQRERKTKEEIRKAVSETIQQTTADQRLDADIAQYTELAPDVLVEGTPTRTQVAEAYNYLVSIGDPPTKATELRALHAALGPLSKLRKVKELPNRQTHEETGGGDEENSSSDDGWPKGMRADAKKYYDSLIERGMYPNRKAVVEMIGKASERTRKRLGA